MIKKKHLFFTVARIPLDFFSTIIGFSIAYKIRQTTTLLPGIEKNFDQESYLNFNEFLPLSIYAGLILIAILALNGHYSLKNPKKFLAEYAELFKSIIFWLLILITYFFLVREFPFSRLVLIYGVLISFLLILLNRLVLTKIKKTRIKKNIGLEKILIIGSNINNQKIAKLLNKNQENLIVAQIPSTDVEQISNIENTIRQYKVDKVILTDHELKEISGLNVIDFFQSNHVELAFIPEIDNIENRRIEVDQNLEIAIINFKSTPLEGWNKIVKRIFDITGSIFGLIIFSPLLLLIAIAIKLDSKGPIIFCRKDDGQPAIRIGQFGKSFTFYKFRSMRPNTDSMRYKELSNQDLRKNSPFVKIKNDPRITRVGRFIRKTSFDELPQFWNVLKGDMSLVGPRPHLPEEVAKYSKNHMFVLNIKPGITGLAQISGRSDLPFEKEIRLDRYYIENWSLWLDIKILFKTLAVPFRGYEE
jgi:exopolysaccharide biosynthesis polyprenyl glycosylphosphotransferase